MSDLEMLTELNREYIRSVQDGDVRRFEDLLADDFLCSHPDGSLVDRQRFLKQIAQPVKLKKIAAHDVNVRIMGDVALIHARTTFTLPDGREGAGRYTDVYAKRGGRWLCVAAHVTRL
jgi:ketosteroid isomerase-like protein